MDIYGMYVLNHSETYKNKTITTFQFLFILSETQSQMQLEHFNQQSVSYHSKTYR